MQRLKKNSVSAPLCLGTKSCPGASSTTSQTFTVPHKPARLSTHPDADRGWELRQSDIRSGTDLGAFHWGMAQVLIENSHKMSKESWPKHKQTCSISSETVKGLLMWHHIHANKVWFYSYINWFTITTNTCLPKTSCFIRGVKYKIGQEGKKGDTAWPKWPLRQSKNFPSLIVLKSLWGMGEMYVFHI